MISAVEEFDQVEDLLARGGLLDADAELQDAAGVGGDDNLGASGAGTLYFLLQ